MIILRSYMMWIDKKATLWSSKFMFCVFCISKKKKKKLSTFEIDIQNKCTWKRMRGKAGEPLTEIPWMLSWSLWGPSIGFGRTGEKKPLPPWLSPTSSLSSHFSSINNSPFIAAKEISPHWLHFFSFIVYYYSSNFCTWICNCWKWRARAFGPNAAFLAITASESGSQ